MALIEHAHSLQDLFMACRLPRLSHLVSLCAFYLSFMMILPHIIIGMSCYYVVIMTCQMLV